MQVYEKLGLNFKDARSLNQIIDHELPQPPSWYHRSFSLEGDGTDYDLYGRDILACLDTIHGNPAFASTMHYAPERHYTTAEKTSRMYHGMHTGEFMWRTQVGNLFMLPL